MDIEQLKLIMETVSSVSGDAAAIAISYIVLVNVLPFICWMSFLCLLYKFGVALISNLTVESDPDFFVEMRDLLRTGTSGPLTANEKTATKAKIRDIAVKSRQ